MQKQEKSKGSLLQELEELMHAHKALKASYEKDIAELKNAEKAMRLADIIFANAGEAILWITPEARITNCNQAASVLLGYSKQELIQSSITEIDTRFSAEKWPEHFARLRKKGTISSFETEHRAKDGRLVPVEVTANYIEYEGQEYNCAFIHDITERKIIENTLLFLTERNWGYPEGDFFATLAKYLGETLSLDYVFISRVDDDGKTARTLANLQMGEIRPNFEYTLKDTPCDNIYGQKLGCYPSGIQKDFPLDSMLADLNAESYCGIPLWDSARKPIGMIALIHTRPLQNIRRIEALLQIVSDHTGHEIERMEAEKKLRKSEQRFKQVAESAGEWIWEVDAHGLYTYASPVVEKILGYTPEEIVGKKYFYELFQPERKEETKNSAFQVFSSKQHLKEFINQNVHKDGTLVWMSTTGSPILDNEGNLLGYQGVDTDISERMKVEEALRESEYFFKESQEAAFIGSYKTYFTEGRWESSLVLDKIFGIDQDYDRSIPGWIEIVHPDDRKMMNDYLVEEVIGKRKTFYKEYRIVRKNDGETRWVLGQGKIDFDDMNRVHSLIGTIQDISQRKQDEYEIRKLNRAVEATSEVVFMTDKEGVITYVNQAFTTVYGYQAEEVVAKVTPRILKSGQMDDSAYEYFWQELINNREIIGELINKTKDGRHIHVEGSSNAILNEAGELIGFIAIQKDITKRKQIEDELVFAKEKAEESDRLKSAFLANMSHEIRTPMNGILGFAALLKEPNLTSDELQEYIQTIQISGERMLNTINSIVDVSKIESGLIELNIKEANINERMAYLFRFFKPEAENKGLLISYREGLPSDQAVIKTDIEKVYGVLTNLIKNAIKFTYEGSIEFGYEKKDGCLEFFVADTGIGIRKDQIEIIFERFRQGSGSVTRAMEGSGLGLSICKSYVEMLGGKIRVESEEGKGSRFCFTIPYHKTLGESSDLLEEEPLESKEAPRSKLKVLIVEDDEVSRILLTNRFKKLGNDILHARNGLEALEACQNNRDIDLVLMDIRMPVMDGLEATGLIRQFNKDVIIIAQTAYAFASDREIAIEAGCNDYISKPINRDQLLALMKKYFHK